MNAIIASCAEILCVGFVRTAKVVLSVSRRQRLSISFIFVAAHVP